MEPNVLRFRAFEVDPARYELRRDGTPVPLQPRLFDLLAYLIGHRDAVVTRDELLDGVWGGVHVSDAALTQAVAALRRALADGGADPVIQTVRGRGYRFVAPVEAAETEPGAPATHFVGRDALLRELEALVDAALAGQPSVVFLWGEPGIGKTRTAEEIARVARGPGVEVLEGLCRQELGALPYWPWLRVVRACERRHSREQLRALLAEADGRRRVPDPRTARAAPPGPGGAGPAIAKTPE